MRDWDDERVTDVARTQAGLPLPGLDVAIRDDDGRRRRRWTARRWASSSCGARG